jgi:hypothetical protein
MICAAAGLFPKALGPKLMLQESAENVMLQKHACTRECAKVKIIGAGVCTWADATQRRKFPLCEIGNGAVELSCQAAPSTHGRLTFGVGGAHKQQQHIKQSPVDGFVIEGAHNSSSFVCFSRGDRNRALCHNSEFAPFVACCLSLANFSPLF